MASERARRGGGKEVAIPQAPALNFTSNYGGATGVGAGWFGPGEPMKPLAPPEVKGRAFDFPQAVNLFTQPRQTAAISFEQLRALADNYDLLRTIIETRKDEMERLRWVIQPKDNKEKLTPQRRNRIKTLTKFFMKPDGEHGWNAWLRMVLEDLFVVDAVSLYRRKTRGGQLIALDQIDGATVRRCLDDWGRTPEGNETAYQQVLKGMPAVNYMRDDLHYRPRNLRVHKIYGFSPVEQILMTISIGLRRQIFQLNFFTEGNIPQALIGVPENWTPDQIRIFQEWFDSLLTGNLGERRRARFVPSAVGKTYVPTQETELFGKAEEWLARVVCYAFSTSPQPFLQMMNRATADTAETVSNTKGLAPIKNWVKDLIDTVLAEDFDEADLEFIWKGDDELDPDKRSQIIDRDLKNGSITLNEGRVDSGREPYEDPRFDQPMFMTSNGFAPIIAPSSAQGEVGNPGNENNRVGREPNEVKTDSIVQKLYEAIENRDQKLLAAYLEELGE